MQPPPRKVKATQELKSAHAEQVSRLQVKHQAECDLLEDMRSYSQKKSAVERDYAQALQKLASQYLKKDWPGIQADQPVNYSGRKSIYAVWRDYLEGTVQVAQSRVGLCHNYRSEVSEPARSTRLHKEQHLKKCLEQLCRAQAELQESVRELEKCRKKHVEMEQMAQAVREKADMEARSRLSLFQSRSSSQKALEKLRARKSECCWRATQARSEYLLSLAAAHAHHQRYYQADLTGCMQDLDCGVYDSFRQYLVSLCQTELDAFPFIQCTYRSLLDTSSAVTQAWSQQLFLQQNPVFQRPADFQFHPDESSEEQRLQVDKGTTEELSLNKETCKWASCAAREQQNLIRYQRTLEECKSQAKLLPEPAASELEVKMEGLRDSIRQAETAKLKAESCLDLLRKSGVSVDTWVKSAMSQAMEELENERWDSLASLPMHDHFQLSTADTEQDDSDEFEDNMEFDDSSSSRSGTLRRYPFTCKVLYSYQASQPDELTIQEQDVLEVIEDGDMEDWVKAKNSSGEVGYVPEKYLQMPTSSSLLSLLHSLASFDTRSQCSSNSAEQDAATGGTEGEAGAGSFVKALYAYEGQTQDELSFPEGAVIRVRWRNGQEDDGYWEGELGGRVGLFPSVLVVSVDAAQGAEMQVSRLSHLTTAYDRSNISTGVTDRMLMRSLPVNGAPSPVYKNAGLSRTSSFQADASLGQIRPVRAPPAPPKQQGHQEITLV